MVGATSSGDRQSAQPAAKPNLLVTGNIAECGLSPSAASFTAPASTRPHG